MAARRELTCAQLYRRPAVLSRRLRATAPGKRIGVVLPPGIGGVHRQPRRHGPGQTPVNLNFTAGRAALDRACSRRNHHDHHRRGAEVEAAEFPWPEQTLDCRRTGGGGRESARCWPWLLAAWLVPKPVVRLAARPAAHRRSRGGGAALYERPLGRPKGVVLSHRNILANCAQISSLSICRRRARCSAACRCSQLRIYRHVVVSDAAWCEVVTVPSPLDTRKIIEAIRTNGDRCSRRAGRSPPDAQEGAVGRMRSLDLIVTGAEKLPDDLFRAFLATFHIEILQGYGLTETTPATNINQPHPPIVTSTGEFQLGKKRGAVGRLMPGMTRASSIRTPAASSR